MTQKKVMKEEPKPMELMKEDPLRQEAFERWYKSNSETKS
jgi:hypothetical protein